MSAGASGLEPPSLMAAKQALQQGDAAAAERLLIGVLAIAPRDAHALRLLGSALGMQGRHADAVQSLRVALAEHADDPLTHNSLGNALGALGDKAGAAAAFARACELAPQLAPAWFNCGKALSEDLRNDEALPVLRRAIELAPDNLRARFLLAHALRVTGQVVEALLEYRRILAEKPYNAEAWLGLVGLNASFDETDVQTMQRAMLDATLNEDDQISIRFALARGLEENRRYPESFAMLCEANARVRRWYPWDAKRFATRVDEFLTAFAKPAPTSAPADLGSEVIFIVSMPRSGSSLAEQILASHPLVDGAGELSDLPAVLHEESQRRGETFPQWVKSCTSADWERLGRRYLERTARWREQRPRYTDKLPDNWRFVGAIAAMLPAARIITCRRDPLETCLACFRQLFSRGGQPFSYALDDLAAYWHAFDRAESHWRALYPDRVRGQIYEALLADPEAQVRELLAFCKLPFDPACLRFHETRRNVRTASATQVREPLRSNTARADSYGAALDPLRAALGYVSGSTRSAE